MTYARSTLTACSAALLLCACGGGELDALDAAPPTLEAVGPNAPAAASTNAPTKAPVGRVMASSPVAPLQGDWFGVDDPNRGLRVSGQAMAFTTNGQAGGLIGFDLVQSCEDRTPAVQLSALVLRGNGAACFAVVSVTGDALELAPGTGRGDTLRFVRR